MKKNLNKLFLALLALGVFTVSAVELHAEPVNFEPVFPIINKCEQAKTQFQVVWYAYTVNYCDSVLASLGGGVGTITPPSNQQVQTVKNQSYLALVKACGGYPWNPGGFGPPPECAPGGTTGGSFGQGTPPPGLPGGGS